MSTDPISRWAELTTYSPPSHHGTTNRLLAGEQHTGGRFSAVHGTLEPGGAAECHLHRVSAQWTHILSGTCLVRLDGEEARLGAGDSVFIAPGVWHEVIVTSDAELTLINVYQPPLQSADIHVPD